MNLLTNMFYDMFCDMDWRQFIPSLIATIVGIFGPFWIQSRLEKANKKKSALSLLEQIRDELNETFNTINGLEDNKRYIEPVKTPVWDGVKNTNEISLLTAIKSSEVWYKKIFSIYGGIDEFNKWWNLYSEQRTAGKTLKDLEPEKRCIAELKDRLCAGEDKPDSIKYLIESLDSVLQKENKKKIKS